MAYFHHRDEGTRTDILPGLQKISPLSVWCSHGVSQLVSQSAEVKGREGGRSQIIKKKGEKVCGKKYKKKDK